MLQSPSAAEGGGAAKSDLLAGAAVQLASGNRSRRSMSTRKARLDDDVTDDEAQAASAAKRPALTAAGDRPMSPRAAARQVPEQIADCEAKLRELQASKEQRLKQEDFLGAHQVKQLVQVEEERLAALRRQLDSMPTPARRPAPAPSPSPKAPAASPKAPSPAADTPKSVPRGPRVSLSLGWAASQARQALQGLRHSPRSVESSGDAVSSAAASAAAKAVAALSCGDDAAEQAEAQDVAGGDAETPEADAEAEETMEVDDEEQDGEWHVSESQPSRVNLKDGDSFHLPKETFDRLYPYQRAGVAWMARLFQKRQGGILADEMGLGKTIQVCSLLNGARKAGATHALILMPVSLLDQWAKEARIWCPGWPVYTYYGTAAQRAMALRRVRRPQGGILLTSYALIGNTEDLLQVNVDDCPSPPYVRGRRPRTAADVRAAKRRKHDDDDGLGEAEDSADEPQEVELPAQLPPSGQWRPWDLVICDEAHRMKNISTLLGKSLRRLQADCRLLLTGTPVQNALQDLWALMDFAQPGLLGNHATFVKTFSDPIDRGSVRGAKVWAVELKKHLADQMRALIGPHILRRTKVGAGLTGVAVDDEEGADEAEEDQEGVVRKLPPKKETIIWLKPTEDQSVSYQKVLEKSEVIREAAAKQKLSIEVFRAIGLLKRLCNHPLLCLPTPKAGAWPELLSEVTAAQAQLEAEKAAAREAAEAAEVSDLEAEPLDLMASEAAAESLDAMGKATAERDDARCGRAVETMLRKLSRSAEALLNQSAKLQCLSELIPSLTKRGHRMLVFSQSVKMLDLIQILILKPNGLRCLRIDGQTDPMSRADKVSKFNNQRDRFQCMLLTTNVGGVGLNLTSANRVIMVDPAWNPATDAQAVDRAFRIGQEKEVRVYRLIMSGMIEDKMFRLQVFKMGLTRTALESSQTHNYFTAREIRALFEWTEAEESETMKLLADKHGEEVNEQVRRMADEDGATAPLPDDDDDDDKEDMSLVVVGDKVLGLKTTVLEEMKESLVLIATLIQSLEDDFVEFLPATCQALLPLLEFQLSEDVREKAFKTWEVIAENARNTAEAGKCAGTVVSDLVGTFLKATVNLMAKVPKEGELTDEVLSGLQAQAQGAAGVIKKAGKGVLGKDDVVGLLKVIVELLARLSAKEDEPASAAGKKGKSKREKEDDDDEESDADDGYVSKQSVRFCVADMAGALMRSNRQDFAEAGQPLFMELVRQFIQPSASNGDRSLAFYICDDLVECLGELSVPSWNIFMEAACVSVTHACPAVRQYAACTVGNAARQPIFSQVAPVAAQQLAKVLQKHGERHRRRRAQTKDAKEVALSVDAAIRALGMICEHQEQNVGGDSTQAWRLWLSNMPLRQDEDEGAKAHAQLLELVVRNHPVITAPEQLPSVLGIFADIYKTRFSNGVLDKELAAAVARAGSGSVTRFAEGLPERQKKKVEQMMKEGGGM
mmetsp:Transcript_86459/g.186951  ORF Transcript_86459/g.186951 Transcript_86459/m.186951 type:complete len:1456 (-) Transcript_86459:31-4398(-)